MLDIYIYEPDKQSEKKLMDICFSYLMANNYEAEAKCSQETVSDIQGLYMIACDDGLEELCITVRTANHLNYIVLLADNPTQLLSAVKPSVCPSGYIIKPVSRENTSVVLDEVYSDYIRCRGTAGGAVFRFKVKAKEFTIPFEKILLFESSNKRLIVHTDTQEFEFYDTLDSVLDKAPDYFMQIHKSFIVNIRRIETADFGGMTVRFDDGTEAFMSRTYRGALKERLAGGKGG